MRKFRARHKKEERWWDKEFDMPLSIRMDGSIAQDVYLEPGIEHVDDDWDIQFATGLSDKNGVEIYDQDFFKNKNGVVFLVFYDDLNGYWTLEHVNAKSHFSDFESEDSTEGEVIGNKIDNPEIWDKPSL